jgi:hypothetical protein
MKLSTYPTLGFGISFDQTKIALTLVQEWPHKNEVIDLCNKKNRKN